jgi:hypothetical protein
MGKFDMSTDYWDYTDDPPEPTHVEHVEGPGEAAVCPVCSRPLRMRNGHAECVSGLCRGRLVEGCCGD